MVSLIARVTLRRKMAICDKAGIVAQAGDGLDVLRWKLQGCLNVTVVGYEGAGERVRATSAGIVVESTIRRL